MQGDLISVMGQFVVDEVITYCGRERRRLLKTLRRFADK